MKKILVAISILALVVVGYAGAQISVSQTQTGAIVTLDSLIVGAQGERIKEISTGTVGIDPPSIGATTRGSQNVTLSGVASGDLVIMVPPAALNDDLIFHHTDVTAANTVTVYIYNPSAGAIDDSARNWRYLWFDMT